MMKKLYFARHGESEMNVKKLLAGTTDTPLTDAGRMQAKKAGQNAQELGIDLIVSSPLSRALETAQIIAKEIGYQKSQIITNKLLIERDHGPLEGQAWSPDLNLDGFSDIETDGTLVERAHLALKWINSHSANHILVVSHGAFGRALRSVLLAEYPMSHPGKLKNAEIVCWIEE